MAFECVSHVFDCVAPNPTLMILLWESSGTCGAQRAGFENRCPPKSDLVSWGPKKPLEGSSSSLGDSQCQAMLLITYGDASQCGYRASHLLRGGGVPQLDCRDCFEEGSEKLVKYHHCGECKDAVYCGGLDRDMRSRANKRLFALAER